MSKPFEDNAEHAAELISLFVDGEEVDAGLLGKALVAPGGRETLLDFLTLRERLQNETNVRPSAEFYGVLEELLSSRSGQKASRGPRLMMVAASLLALGAMIGFGAGLSRAQRSGPPPASRIFHFEPGADWYAHASEEPSEPSEEPR